MSNPIIQTEEITKRFGKLVAVDRLTLSVEAGEVFGLLGQNGSGKTTLIRMLNTLLPVTSGRGWVCGKDVLRDSKEIRRRIGVVPQALTSDTELTALENMDIYARFYDVEPAQRRERIERLLKQVDLWEFRHKLVGTFSGGMRRRLEIARGLVHRPSLLILDEPTIGLDPSSRRKVWALLQELLEEFDLTVLLTTHYLDEAEHLCHRVGIIDHGRLRALGSPQELCHRIPGSQRIILSMDLEHEEASTFLTRLPGVERVESLGEDFELTVSKASPVLTVLVEGCARRGCVIKTVTVRSVTLEDAFIYFVGHDLRDEIVDFQPGGVGMI